MAGEFRVRKAKAGWLVFEIERKNALHRNMVEIFFRSR